VEARAASTISRVAASIIIPLFWSAIFETDSRRRIPTATTHKHIPKITKLAGSEIGAVAWPINPAKDLTSATNITGFISHGSEHKAKSSNRVSNPELGALPSETYDNALKKSRLAKVMIKGDGSRTQPNR
jgi:hypothetical protein